MEFFIKKVIEQLKEWKSEQIGNKNERKSFALDPNKHNKKPDLKRKKDGKCC